MTDETRHIPIIIAQPAMLRHLLLARRENSPHLRLHNHIRDALICEGGAEPESGRVGACEHIQNAQSRGVAREVFRRRGDFGCGIQPNQRNIVARLMRDRDADLCRDEGGVDFFEQGGIDGGLAVFCRDDY